MRTKPLPDAFAYGIDIGKKVFHVVAVNREGAVIQRAKFSRETLQSFFDAASKVLIGMEACPCSFATTGHFQHALVRNAKMKICILASSIWPRARVLWHTMRNGMCSVLVFQR